MASNNIRMRVLLNVEGKNTVVEVSSSVKELQREEQGRPFQGKHEHALQHLHAGP